MKNTKQKNSNKSLHVYCQDYITNLNTKYLSSEWKRKAAYLAALGAITASTLLVNPTASQAQTSSCGPTLTPVIDPINIPFADGSTPNYSKPTFVDIDGDGDFDIFVGSDLQLFFYRNTGTDTNPQYDGTAGATNQFGIVVPTPTPGTYSYLAPTFVDIDNDGDQDLFLGTYDSGVFFYENTGTDTAPNFAAAVQDPFGSVNTYDYAGDYNSTPAFADIDGDGDQDMLVGSQTGKLYYYENFGTASVPDFAGLGTGEPVNNPFGLVDQDQYSTPAFVDLDGDGDIDLMVGGTSGDFFYFENNGTAVVTTATAIFNAATTNSFEILNTNTVVGYGASAPAFADIDGDGDFDMFSGAKKKGPFLEYENVGTATNPDFLDLPYDIRPVSGYATPTLGDTDNDGDLDIYIGNADGEVIFFNNITTVPSDPRFDNTVVTTVITTASTFASPTLGDLDNDGDLDMIIGGTDGNFRYYRNNGSAAVANFGLFGTNPFGLIDAGAYSTPELVDFDGDGDLDMFAGRTGAPAGLWYFQNTGTAAAPTFAAPVLNPFGLRPGSVPNFSSVSFGDVDGDGDLDMMVGSGTQINYFQNLENPTTGQANFVLPVVNPFNVNTDDSYFAPYLGNLDDDGQLELLVGETAGFTRAYNLSTVSATPFFLDLGADRTACASDGVTLTAQGGSSFRWFENGVLLAGETGSSLNVNFTAATIQTRTYVVEASGGGCVVADEVSVTLLPTPVLDVVDRYECNAVGSVVINASVPSFSATSVYTFSNASGTVLQTGTSPNFTVNYNNPAASTIESLGFSVRVVDPTRAAQPNCATVTDNFTVFYNYAADIAAVTDPITTSVDTLGINCATGTKVELNPSNFGTFDSNLRYSWMYTDPSGLVSYEASPVYSLLVKREGTYVITVTSTSPIGSVCTYTDTFVAKCVTGSEPFELTLEGQAGYNVVDLKWNYDANNPPREYEVYSDPGNYGSYFFTGTTSDTTYRVVGLINGESVTFKVRPVYGAGAYGLYSNTVTVKPSIILGEDENEKAGFAFYPNPNSGEFNLRLQDGSTSASVTVISLSGQRVYTTTLNANQTSINLGNVASGMYIVRVETAKGTYQQKVSVVR